MQYFDEYLEYLEINQVLSFNSLRLYKRDLKDFADFLLDRAIGSFEFASLSSELLSDFVNYIYDQGKTTATVNRKLTALHGFWSWLQDQGQVSRDPFLQVKRETQFRNKKALALSQEEIVLLLDCDRLDLKTKMILELIYATGIRVSELVQLTLVDIDLDNQIITIPRSARFKERTIPFNKLLAGYLTNYIANHELTENSPLLLNRKNTHVSEREIFRVIREAAELAGLSQKVTPSIIRNSFLKHMKENGAHDTLLKDITGQKIVNA